jgi:hypothetical protein
MSNSPRAKARRTKRSKLKKSQRASLGKQHFGDKTSKDQFGGIQKGKQGKGLIKGLFGMGSNE